jgi:uncharacterized membrane protein (DUF4010 family)
MIIPLDGLVIATLGGAAIGLERQWSGHATGPQARFGGIRTFTLLGILGGLAGGFATAGMLAPSAVILGAAAALVAIGYAAKSRHDIDATTEVAAIVVLAAGAIGGAGQIRLASGIVAVSALLLLEKSRLHALVARLDDVTIRASARFAVLALVVLPLLPAGAYGPFGAVRPRELWAVVLFFSGLSFAAWLARRLLGPEQGTVAAGVLGGLISSTSVTLSFARASRTHESALPLAMGTIGACTVMLVRVGVASAILNWPVARAFAWYAWPSLLVGLVTLAPVLRLPRSGGEPPLVNGSPLQLRTALEMGALFQVVMLAVAAVVAWWSVTALFATSALIGLTDLDALTLSIARGADVPPDVAGRALVVGVLANTLLKLGVAVVMGRGAYRSTAGVSLAAIAAAALAAVTWL